MSSLDPTSAFAKAFSSTWLAVWALQQPYCRSFQVQVCNGVSEAVVSTVNKASLLTYKDVVVGTIFTTYTILGYISNK